MEHNRDEDVQKIIKAANVGGELGLVNLFHSMFKDDFVYLGKKYGWYAFEQPRWFPDCGVSLIRKMDTDLIRNVEIVLNSLKNEEFGSAKDMEVVSKMLRKLQNINYKHRVVVMLKDWYRVNASDWLSALDSNKRLLGFDDCVFDFNENAFREGLPSDMISLSTRHRRDDMVIREDMCNKITTVLNEMHGSGEVSQYMLHFLSTSLVGNRPENYFQIWTGCGEYDGRRLTKHLVASAFGGYYYEARSTLFTRTRTAGSKMLKLKGKRICMSSECERGNKLCPVMLKPCLGGDTIRVKISQSSYPSEAVTFKSHANIVMLYNKVPTLQGSPRSKAGIRRRMDLINFGYDFVDVPCSPHEKPLDKWLHHLFQTKEYGACFLKMLIDMFTKHGFHFQRPENVKQHDTK